MAAAHRAAAATWSAVAMPLVSMPEVPEVPEVPEWPGMTVWVVWVTEIVVLCGLPWNFPAKAGATLVRDTARASDPAVTTILERCLMTCSPVAAAIPGGIEPTLP